MPANKIRVLHLIEHLDVGGAERAAVDIITALDREQFDSTCCVYRHSGAFAEQLQRQNYPLVLLKKAWVSEKLSAWLGADSIRCPTAQPALSNGGITAVCDAPGRHYPT